MPAGAAHPIRGIRRLARAGMLAALMLAAAGVQSVRAEVRAIYETGGRALFSIAVPDGWVVATGSGSEEDGVPRILGITPEGDFSLWIGFLSPEEPRDINEAEAYVRDLGTKLVDDSRVERVADGELGVLPARLYLGQGTRAGAPIDIGVAIAALPGPRAVIGVIVGENGAREVYDLDIAAILGSLVPVEENR
ncbi:hypothetical protein LNKW23_32030 [Paralimibaculum aggregatum]|uniref:Uncharacterized protein n=1 Tax=Paralimibaculum aggregatum TaxID=3036245 RepID=A0ABQ6LLB4_9RHOB|nr:hypothetical protein [Limibaculum sp. NKW23]GMG83989.1 hypothetical protein LNKW23_32030 [Limibaculum sp. NKW23]